MEFYKAYILIIFFSVLNIFCGGEESTPTESTQAQTGTISGIVSDAETTLPIGFAHITTRPPTSAVTTDTLGEYTITNVLPDTYSVAAAKPGYDKDSILIYIVAGNTTIGDIQIYQDTAYVAP